VRSLVPLGVSIALLLGSCADPPATDPSDVLTARVASIRVAIENGNAERARILLDRLEGVVARLLDRNGLTEQQAVEIVTAADDVADALSLIESEPSPSPTLSSTPSPDEDDDEGHGNDEEHGKGKGKGKGNGHGNGQGNGGD
jgi:hypothetical protein